jgi:hypothetical protein
MRHGPGANRPFYILTQAVFLHQNNMKPKRKSAHAGDGQKSAARSKCGDYSHAAEKIKS